MKGAISAYLAALVVFAGGAAQAADWPAFMGGPGRTGEAADSSIRPPLKLLWRFRTDGSVRGSICVVDRVAYACSRDGCVYALDAKTGRLLWRKQLGGLERATPSVAHGKVFVVLNAYKDCKVYALDAKTGEEVWSRAVPARNITRTGPLLVDDAVITFCWIEEEKKSGLVCLEAESGRERWRVTGRHEFVGDPSSDGETVFFAGSEGARDKASELLAVRVKTGEVLWRND
ncbi:MAG TPA: PQQ-binding-like beta-propeller repeat protein, partial [Planctomycetota bacterium]|nr:PQQ-binding-like beta-propeller repeat protein [Planctomycetota bacterium]